MSRLSDLLAQVSKLDAGLGADLDAEFKALSSRRAFGLNFERHKPEAVELPGRPVRRGDTVRVLPPRDGSEPADKRLWFVRGVTRGEATLVSVVEEADGRLEAKVLVDDLVVIAEFRDQIYPGLVSTGSVERGGDKPFHTVINGENFHALQALAYTHEGRVDAIYIDPPYNTGNQGWIYNDAYVAADDIYKHSKWLAFMERRLKLARRLLKPTGVLIVAIGDDEHHRLRMLLDQVFGAENFIADVVWQGSGSSVARHHAGGQDYMLIYSTDAAQAPRFRDPKPKAGEMLAVVAESFAAGGTSEDAQRALRQFIRENRSAIAPGLAGFNSVDAEGRIYDTADITNRLHRPNLKYEVADPTTGQVFEPPANGWTLSREVMDEYIAKGLISFAGSVPRKKKHLEEYLHEMPLPTFLRSRSAASAHLAEVVGAGRFPFPKDHEVLMRWLRMVTPVDGVILDYFGGSGSTTEAVMRLNEEDGGTRQCILVTNNEVSADDAKRLGRAGWRRGDAEWESRGVYEYVAKPRIATVVTGVRTDGSTYSEGLEQNAEFFTLTYESPVSVRYGRAFARIAPLLWLRAGAQGRRIEEVSEDFDIADTYGVLFDLDAAGGFVTALRASSTSEASSTSDSSSTSGVRMVFIVTDDERGYQSVVADLPEGIEPVRLYSSYLTNFAFSGDVD